MDWFEDYRAATVIVPILSAKGWSPWVKCLYSLFLNRYDHQGRSVEPIIVPNRKQLDCRMMVQRSSEYEALKLDLLIRIHQINRWVSSCEVRKIFLALLKASGCAGVLITSTALRKESRCNLHEMQTSDSTHNRSVWLPFIGNHRRPRRIPAPLVPYSTGDHWINNTYQRRQGYVGTVI